MTVRKDAVEMLEKRVRSRFGHRRMFVPDPLDEHPPPAAGPPFCGPTCGAPFMGFFSPVHMRSTGNIHPALNLLGS